MVMQPSRQETRGAGRRSRRMMRPGPSPLGSSRATRRACWREAMALGALLNVVACAPTPVRPHAAASSDSSLPRPERIAVLPFAVSAGDVTENQAIGERIKDSFLSSTASERQLEIGHKVSDRMADDLVSGIRALGLSADRVDRNAVLAPGTLVIDGRFTRVDEGNRLRRLVIGFGAGQSDVDAEVEVDLQTASGRDTVLAFSTDARSAPMPGAAVTMGAGAAAQGGVTAASVAASGGVGALKEGRASVDSDAGHTAKQIVAYLSEFFARQGWISAEHVERAKVDES